MTQPETIPAFDTYADIEFTAPPRSRGRIALARFLHNWLAMSSLVILLGWVVFCCIYPLFYKWDYNNPDLHAQSVRPGRSGHFLGTDGTGFDLFAQIMRGTQREVVIVVVATCVATTLGTIIGSLAGYNAGVLDNIIMRFVDIMLAIPALVILIVVAGHYQLGAAGLAVLIGAFGWMGLSRLVRGQILSLRELEFIEAAHARGATSVRIVIRHLLPNVINSILVFGTLFAAVSIIAETSLTYLGYGVQPPDTSLGLLISSGVNAVDTRGWLFYYPGVVVLILVLCINLIGDGIRTAFDPRATESSS